MQTLIHSLETMQSLSHSPGHCAEPRSQPRLLCRVWVTAQVTVQSLGNCLETMQSLGHRRLPHSPASWCVLSLTSYIPYADILSMHLAELVT